MAAPVPATPNPVKKTPAISRKRMCDARAAAFAVVWAASIPAWKTRSFDRRLPAIFPRIRSIWRDCDTVPGFYCLYQSARGKRDLAVAHSCVLLWNEAVTQGWRSLSFHCETRGGKG